jgi:hypothetical protein
MGGMSYNVWLRGLCAGVSWFHLSCFQAGAFRLMHSAGKHNRQNHDTPAHGPYNHTLYDITPVRFVFQVTQTDPRSSLMIERLLPEHVGASIWNKESVQVSA